MSRVDTYRKTVDQLLARHRFAAERAVRERVALDRAGADSAAVEESQLIVQRIAHALQQRAHERIAAVVTRCLAAVFDDPYEFRIRFDCKRSKTEAVLAFVRDGKEYDDPLNEVGGGVIDVAGLALRLACVMLSKPPKRRLLILDEPFRFVAKCFRPRVRSMMEELAGELGFQFIMTTHIEDFQMGKVVEMS